MEGKTFTYHLTYRKGSLLSHNNWPSSGAGDAICDLYKSSLGFFFLNSYLWHLQVVHIMF